MADSHLHIRRSDPRAAGIPRKDVIMTKMKPQRSRGEADQLPKGRKRLAATAGVHFRGVFHTIATVCP